jgi:hypothetical protein
VDGSRLDMGRVDLDILCDTAKYCVVPPVVIEKA